MIPVFVTKNVIMTTLVRFKITNEFVNFLIFLHTLLKYFFVLWLYFEGNLDSAQIFENITLQ